MNTPPRGFVNIVILIIVVLALGGVVGYAALQNKSYFESAYQAPSNQTAPVASEVEKISWQIKPAHPEISNPDDYHKLEDSVAITVTFVDGTTKQYSLGNGFGCEGKVAESMQNGRKILGTVECYFAESGAHFTAYKQNGTFTVEKTVDSGKDASFNTTTVVLTVGGATSGTHTVLEGYFNVDKSAYANGTKAGVFTVNNANASNGRWDVYTLTNQTDVYQQFAVPESAPPDCAWLIKATIEISNPQPIAGKPNEFTANLLRVDIKYPARSVCI